MAKKQKRKITTGAVTQKETPSKVQPVSVRTASAEFNPDYTYVKKDLRRIGLLAGSFFVVLIVLSFFLR